MSPRLCPVCSTPEILGCDCPPKAARAAQRGPLPAPPERGEPCSFGLVARGLPREAVAAVLRRTADQLDDGVVGLAYLATDGTSFEWQVRR